jgi:hypothetical protein
MTALPLPRDSESKHLLALGFAQACHVLVLHMPAISNIENRLEVRRGASLRVSAWIGLNIVPMNCEGSITCVTIGSRRAGRPAAHQGPCQEGPLPESSATGTAAAAPLFLSASCLAFLNNPPNPHPPPQSPFSSDGLPSCLCLFKAKQAGRLAIQVYL